MWQSCDLIGPWSAHIISAAACSNMQHNVCMRVCVCAFPAYLVLRVIESRWHISICMKGVKSERDAALYAGSCNGSGFSVFYIRCSRADRDEKKETAGKTNKANQNQADPNSDSSRAWWYRAFLIAVPQASDIYQIFKKTKKKKTSLMMLALLLKLQHVLHHLLSVAAGSEHREK